MKRPDYWYKHPCTNCNTGYKFCIQGLSMGLMCCTSCEHPGRWQPDPYTLDELRAMKAES